MPLSGHRVAFLDGKAYERALATRAALRRAGQKTVAQRYGGRGVAAHAPRPCKSAGVRHGDGDATK